MQNPSDLLLHGEAYKDALTQPIVVRLEYPTTDGGEIRCTVLFAEGTKPSEVICEDKEGRHFFQIHCKIYQNNDLWIPIFRFNSVQHSEGVKYTGNAEYFYEIFNFNTADIKAKLECYFMLPDNSLSARYDTDNIFRWQTPFGAAELIFDYAYGGYIGTVSKYNQPQKYDLLHITIDNVNDENIHTLINELHEYMYKLAWLLSFMCGKYIHWHSAHIFSQFEKGIRTIKTYQDISWINPYQMNLSNTDDGLPFSPLDFDFLRKDYGEKMIASYFADSHHLV